MVDGLFLKSSCLFALIRREAILKDSDSTFGTCSILLHCAHGMECATTTLIAAYCFLYGWMQFQESIHFAEVAMQVKSSKVGIGVERVYVSLCSFLSLACHTGITSECNKVLGRAS